MPNFIEKLFGKKDSNGSSVKTAPLSERPISELPQPPLVALEPGQLLVGCCQSVGKQREKNEDSIFVMNTILAGEGENLPFGIFIIADGMGGHENGEAASGTAVRVMGASLVQKLFLPFLGFPSGRDGESLQDIMRNGVQEAQQAVLRQVPGGGTTLTAAFILGEKVTLAHVGDSRAYFVYPDGRTEVITRDHSLVRRLQELGEITEKEAAVHPQRNVLYRAIGQGEPFEADVNTYELSRPGTLMLCSDGLWGYVPEEKIAASIRSASHPLEAAKALVQAANDAGGPDNISVIIVQQPH